MHTEGPFARVTSLPSFAFALASMSLAGGLVLVACSTTPPPAPPRDDTAAPAVTPVPPTASTSTTISVPDAAALNDPSSSDGGNATGDAGVAGTKSSACKTDADCRTFASYCSESPCACRVLPKGDADPTCVGSGPKVQCFVNPCLKKVAHCESNVCVLVAQTPSAAPKPTK